MRNLVRLPLGLALFAALAAPVAAQEHAGHGAHDMQMPTSGYRADLIRDVEQLEKKYLGLADAMKGKYAWRPAQGVRSVGEVFMHISAGNLGIPGMMAGGMKGPQTVAGVAVRDLEKNGADEAKVREALQQSFTHAKHAIAMMPEENLGTATKLFGQDSTNRAVLHLLVTHMHEHLGQSIAYARSNGVTPPWSGGN